MVYKVPNVSFGNKTCSVPGNPLSWNACSTSSVILQSWFSAAIYWSFPFFPNPENFYLNRLVRLRNPL